MSILRNFRRLVQAALGLLLLAGSVHATSVVPPSFTELVNESDYIVRAVVKSVTSEWSTGSSRRHIVTKVELEVLEVISGTPPQPLVLKMLGGKVGSEEMVIEGLPKFEVGQEDILFIRGNGRQFYPLTAAMHGRYPIHRDAAGQAHVHRSNQAPLHAAAEVAMSMSEESATQAQSVQASAGTAALTTEEFTRQIRAAVNVNAYRAAHAN